jgi:hypothetical protein
MNHPLDERALQDAWNREWAFAEGWPKEKTSLWVVVRTRDQTDVEFADGVVACGAAKSTPRRPVI